MKILQINSFYNQSGAGKIVTWLHEELKKRGHESKVIYGRGRNTKHNNVYKISSSWEVKLEGIITRVVGIHGFSNIIATQKIIKLIKDYKPDVIHLHALHGYYINNVMLMKYINKNNIPCVWTFHDCLAFTGNCGYFYECDKWKVGCSKCNKIKEYPKSFIFDFTKFMWKAKKKYFTKGENKIIASPSNWLTKYAKESFFSKYECVTVNNGIDTENIFYYRNKNDSRKKHGFEIDDKIILAIAYGFDDPRKGSKYILELARNLKNKKNVKFILIGWNKKDNNLLEGLYNVKTLEFTHDQHELAEYYSLADVFVLPSLAENYATVVLESLACGTPVVGFNAGGTSEQLSDGRGIVVDIGNYKQLEEGVCSIINNEAEISDSEEIINYIKNNNSITSMTDKYLELYLSVLEKNISK